MKNIPYQTEELSHYFDKNRITWSQFYESERVIISQINPNSSQSILDIGCGCGGLGLALRDQFGINQYTGVEINEAAAKTGRGMNPNANIYCGDILDLTKMELSGKQFDIVFSLSCVDWNVQYLDMLLSAWKHVRPGGYFISTFRLTDKEGCIDMDKSYQFINYEGIKKGELASYVVLNAKELMEQIETFNPLKINAYGYWGAPSSTAVTPYKRLCFAAFSIQKRSDKDIQPIEFDLKMPSEILFNISSTA
ncbi:class I SAM-dependent methyltransferase [Leptospira stimsonii]|uniref:Class I SAM-dependent methyltransferase n=1 Tax=Leptospira stimsonii TaxID=2202203 RepID=A0ABY2MW91_9LEPT|nr:class I SAM-dependent methyltransferase [Leptospira stimsonii]TGK14551.1 class I SAM-dependent methyltransferase [Leptospira stimsonii]TGM09974.1 class I SAM-dependent methyltransferase [Leptospira stimsonii]